MSWINSGQFRLVTNRPGKRYIFRRSNNGNSEYNVPNSVRTKRDAKQWLLSKKNVKPTRFIPKKVAYVSTIPSLLMNTKVPWRPGYVPKLGPRQGETKERFEYNRYVGYKYPYTGGSPKYAAESPTLIRLRKAALKSEGQKVSPGSPVKKFSCTIDRKGIVHLGDGRQGDVYKLRGVALKVSARDLRAASRKEKQPSVVEFENQMIAFKACPEGVVEPYEQIRCVNFIDPSTLKASNVKNKPRQYDASKQSIIFMEYCSKGTLDAYIKNKKLTDSDLFKTLGNILKFLSKIMKDYPDFRHNDLWSANVFISTRGPLLGDFGWSRIKKNGTNPAVNTANGPNAVTNTGKWGVGPHTDARYDMHLILNDVRSEIIRTGGYPKTLEFLDWALPSGYRGMNGRHVSEARLKYRDPCPGLMTVEQILNSKYFRNLKFNSNNLIAARGRLLKVAPPPQKKSKLIKSLNLRAALRKLRPVRPRAAITAAMLKKVKEGLKAAHKTTKAMKAAMFKNARFDKLVEKLWINAGAVSGKNYTNAWSKARNKAVRLVELRLNRGNAPFSAGQTSIKKSPPKKNSPVKSPPKNLAAAAKRLKNQAEAIKAARMKIIQIPVATRNKSGRVKMLAPTGRMVYMNLHMSMDEIKKLAASKGVSTKGLRSKAEIIAKIFS